MILRNGNDNEVTKTAGREVNQLFNGYTKAPKVKAVNDDGAAMPPPRPKPIVRRQVQVAAADPVAQPAKRVRKTPAKTGDA